MRGQAIARVLGCFSFVGRPPNGDTLTLFARAHAARIRVTPLPFVWCTTRLPGVVTSPTDYVRTRRPLLFSPSNGLASSTTLHVPVLRRLATFILSLAPAAQDTRGLLLERCRPALNSTGTATANLWIVLLCKGRRGLFNPRNSGLFTRYIIARMFGIIVPPA